MSKIAGFTKTLFLRYERNTDGLFLTLMDIFWHSNQARWKLNNETYGYLPLADLPEAEYNAEKDVTKYPGAKAETYVNCKPGEFAIFWPQDGHQPCIGEGDIHKAIFKVKA